MCKSRFVTNSIFFDHKLKIRKSVKKLARTGTFRATTAAPLPTSHLSLRRFLSLSLSLCVSMFPHDWAMVCWYYGCTAVTSLLAAATLPRGTIESDKP